MPQSAEKRIGFVKRIFGDIAPRYDLLNHLMSAGQDMRWRKFAAEHLPDDTRMVLDVACGTGDMSLAVIRRRPEVNVGGLDFVMEMVSLARAKSARAGVSSRIQHVVGDAMCLPFDDDRFDAAIVAFGFRNMPERARALGEMRRVVRSGGRVMVLEMTLPRNMKMIRFFKWYLRNVIPLLGGLISRNRGAYKYLPDSIEDFLKPDELIACFERVGLQSVMAFPLTPGITYLHQGIVP
ncbi:MAG: ubiquinone/menaquinone biosynthesis methyltransferase [Candidatus Zixiibacteriota bacterium]|nr:MAG: ubiquinone/menaquinone biosynthesis methyltransferase [candidate division Zixibacteria bacterium]